jgi:DNA-directed RNA polymerase III subunit RPC1
MGKQQFRQPDHTRKVIGVKFGAGSTELIKQVAHIPIFNNRLYEEATGKWSPAPFGPLDKRLGTFQKSANCETCGLGLTDCVGHFGYVDLEYPVFHVGFFRLVIQMLQCICKSCAGTLLTGEQKEGFLRQLHNPNLDYLRRKVLHKRIVEASKKISHCPHCGFQNGVVKKAVGAVLKIAHGDPVKTECLSDFEAARENKELQNLIPASSTRLHSSIRRVRTESGNE